MSCSECSSGQGFFSQDSLQQVLYFSAFEAERRNAMQVRPQNPIPHASPRIPTHPHASQRIPTHCLMRMRTSQQQTLMWMP